MNKSVVSVILTFVFTMVLISGCNPAVTSLQVSPTLTSVSTPSTFTPEPISTTTVTPTKTPTDTPAPTATPITNEELAMSLGVTVIKRGVVSDDLIRLDLLGFKADQDYFIRHGISTVFPPIRLEIADSKASGVNCEVVIKNGKITVLQNTPFCYTDRNPVNWLNATSNEGMNIYLQFAVGLNSSSEFNTATWLWIEGSANYFGWQALFENKLATPDQNTIPFDELEQGVYSVDDLLNSNDIDASGIGYYFFDFLIHKDGNDQKKIDENIRKVYDVFTIIGNTNIPSSKAKRQQVMMDAVLTVFGESEANLYSDFLAKMKK